MEYITKVHSSSSDDVYTIIINVDDPLIKLNCDCAAGSIGNVCKHRLSLLKKDYAAVVNISNLQELDNVINKIDKKRVDALYTDLNNAEDELKQFKKIITNLKMEIGYKMSNGF